MLKRIILYGMVLVLLCPGYALAQVDRSAEVQKLAAGLDSASQVQRVNAAKVISRSGLQDQALYRKVAGMLSAGYMQEYEADHADEMSWLCKALAASGNLHYRELLDEVAVKSPSIKIKRYAKQSSGLLEQYAQQSLILNSTEVWDEQLSEEGNRLVNMLRSDDIGLRRDAAKIILREIATDKKVFAAAATALSDMSINFSSDAKYVDTMSWMCKVLAASGEGMYITLLEEVYGNTQSVKLRSYASKAVAALR